MLKQLISIVAASSFVLITQLLTKDIFSLPFLFGISSLLISLVMGSGAVILRMFMENREVGITDQHVELDRRALALSGATLVFGLLLILVEVNIYIAGFFFILFMIACFVVPALADKLEENAKDTKELKTSTAVVDPETVEEAVSSA